MGYLTKQWSPMDQALQEDREKRYLGAMADIRGMRRTHATKTCKPTVQLRSFKDPKKKPSRIMWIRRKTKKRKSRLAKLKHRRSGDYSPNWRWAKKEEQMYYPEPHNDFAAQAREDYLKSFQPRQSTADILASEGVDTVYRRKHSKKKQKKRRKK
jgi:hypothetical protein